MQAVSVKSQICVESAGIRACGFAVACVFLRVSVQAVFVRCRPGVGGGNLCCATGPSFADLGRVLRCRVQIALYWLLHSNCPAARFVMPASQHQRLQGPVSIQDLRALCTSKTSEPSQHQRLQSLVCASKTSKSCQHQRIQSPVSTNDFRVLSRNQTAEQGPMSTKDFRALWASKTSDSGTIASFGLGCSLAALAKVPKAAAERLRLFWQRPSALVAALQPWQWCLKLQGNV